MPRHQVSTGQRQFARQLRTEQTALEGALWRELRTNRLDGWKFKRQAPIETYVVDFGCFSERLIVEADGPLHTRPEQRLRDAERDAVLRSAGFRILRFDEIAILGDLSRVIEDIRQALALAPLPTPD